MGQRASARDELGSPKTLAAADTHGHHGSTALGALLDDQPDASLADNGLADEQELRQRAEAAAQDKENRLRVAQEQLAEYAVQKERDARSTLQAAAALQASLQAAAGSLPEAVQKQLETLSRMLADNAAEAEAFATQQKLDVETLKRQAGWASDDTDMKRQKESDDNETAEQNGGPDEDNAMEASDEDAAVPSSSQAASFAERARYIPMRLEQHERRFLRLLEAAMNVSEYTDKVDILSYRNKTQRMTTQIKDICAILSGLVVAQDYKAGQDLIKERNFADNEKFFQAVFEIGRRYKIMNPDKMRSEYGKLMYLLMDSTDSNVQELLEFNCVKELVTVHSFLEARGGSKVLQDPLMNIATAEIATGERSRYEIQKDIKLKEKARETLAKRYCNANLTQDQILSAIYSFSDNNSFLLYNRDPIVRMLQYFKHFFRPDCAEQGFSLAIQQGGRGGARLTHNHERQYHYVLQSLTLWREISTDMFKLWYLTDCDLLREGNHYRLCDTGQGLNRVQAAPGVGRAMQQILARCQSQIGSWVGSSVVHLGDHNVPSALMFIDKYSQVPRILNPVVMVLDELPKLMKDPKLATYVNSTFGSMEDCRKHILADFCRHAFDGSGADNFFDAGSCIDGRLTSAWNWCSKLESKPYYPVFKLAGFHSFDGDFK